MKHNVSVISEEIRQLSRYPYRVKKAVLEGMTDYMPDCRRVVFLGDSLMEYGQWQEMLDMEDVAIYNRGIAGDTINGVCTRLASVERLFPHKIFLMIGINNLSMGQDVKDVARDYRYLIDVMQGKFHSADTEIFLLSVLPINKELCRNPYLKGNEDIIELNRKICSFCKGKDGMTYIDIYSSMLDESEQLNPCYTIDGIHLDSEGYAVWFSCIDDLL